MYEDLIEEKVSSEDIFDGVLLHVKRDYVKLPNGNKAVREWIKHQGASAVIPVLPNGNIILVNDTTNNIENLNHFKHSDDIDYIRNKIYNDYSQAGWQVSWDEKFYPDGRAYYVLKIAR